MSRRKTPDSKKHMSASDAPELICTASALEAACARLAESPFIALDTEFHRESTYWPHLCLIQAAIVDFDVIIDPLAEGLSLRPFLDLLADPARVKVFHAGRQDMEIFTRLLGAPPVPVFDTQIAAMACGFGGDISYEALVGGILGQGLDKTWRFADWTRRPLSPEQLCYARFDVTYLRDLYPILHQKLEAQGRMEWIRDEIAVLEDAETYDMTAERAYKRLKQRKTSHQYRAVLTALAAWREDRAQALNKPRGRILKDEALQELALRPPKAVADLERSRMISSGFGRSRYGAGLIEAVQSALETPDHYAPAKMQANPRLPRGSALGDLLRVLLKHVAENAGIAPRLIASAEDLDRIAAEDKPEVRALSGWRLDVFGQMALDLKAGRLALSASGDTVYPVPIGK